MSESQGVEGWEVVDWGMEESGEKVMQQKLRRPGTGQVPVENRAPTESESPISVPKAEDVAGCRLETKHQRLWSLGHGF